MYKEKYYEWLNNPIIDENTKEELRAISDDEKEIEDRFYKDLEFGTAGLRGLMGAGLNRMNQYTVGRATQGLANYIKKIGKENEGVVIAYDSRHHSKEFAIRTALILNANGIRTYIFESLRPVPELSFSVRYLKCIAGVMITASHNPGKYNGYKVYWEDGAQIVPPIDTAIIEEVSKISFEDIKESTLEEAKESNLFTVVGEDVDNAFCYKIESLVLNPDVIKNANDLKIVYTPLHGTAGKLVRRIFDDLGFKNLYIVSAQEEPDGDFPTVAFPNPEDPKSFRLALDMAKSIDADIVIANDPDADRIGMYVRKDDDYVPFTGNMTALLLLEYELSQRKDRGLIPENSAVITTIVSSEMTKAIAKAYDCKTFETLTGFKWAGELIRRWEEENKPYKFQFAFEESFGLILSDHARDKDGISAAMALGEAAAYYKSKGLSLYDELQEMYKKYGYYKEYGVSIVKEGAEGQKAISDKMESLRSNVPQDFAGYKITEVRDYKNHTIVKDSGEILETTLPTSNVIYYCMEDEAWCAVRPSGTEPKIKLYIGVKGNTQEEADEKLEKLRNAIETYLDL